MMNMRLEECFQPSPRTAFLVPQDAAVTETKPPPVSDAGPMPANIGDKDPRRRAVPVEVGPLEQPPTGGGQGQLPDADVIRRAVPVETQPLEVPATGGGQGQAPEEDVIRRAQPVETQPLPIDQAQLQGEESEALPGDMSADEGS